MIVDIALCYILQISFTIGIIVIFGFLIAQCNRWFYSNFGNYGKTVCYITGAVGTPIHECSHALFCLIFKHKINQIKLFQIDSKDGTLGYVNHSFNPKSVYQKIGNFFIGIAPIIVISAIQYLLALFLLPNFKLEINGSFNLNDFIGSIRDVLIVINNTLQSFFSDALLWQWWIFVIIGFFLSLHMTLSKADIKGSLSGVVLINVLLLFVDIILYFINTKLLINFTQVVLKIGSFLLCILFLSLIISILSLMVSFIFRVIKWIC